MITSNYAKAHSYTYKAIKSLILLLASALIFFTNAKAQKHSHSFSDSLKNRLTLGLTGGVSLNKFADDQPQTGYSTGYTAGILVNYSVYKGFGLQLEANFLQQGGQLITFKDDTRYGLPESFETKNVKNSYFNLNSLEIPLLVTYKFKIHQSWVPSIYAGASYAYNLNVVENYQKTGNLLPGADIIATASNTEGATSLFNSYRVNFIVGANALLPLSSRLKLLIDFRYLNGLTAAREGYSYMEKAGFGSDIRSDSYVARLGIIMSLHK